MTISLNRTFLGKFSGEPGVTLDGTVQAPFSKQYHFQELVIFSVSNRLLSGLGTSIRQLSLII